MKRTAASSNRRIDNADRFDRLFDTSIETRLRRASCKPGPALVQTDERCVTASVGSRVLCSSELNLASESSSSALGGVPRQVHGCEAYPVTEDLREWHLDLHPTAGPLEGGIAGGREIRSWRNDLLCGSANRLSQKLRCRCCNLASSRRTRWRGAGTRFYVTSHRSRRSD